VVLSIIPVLLKAKQHTPVCLCRRTTLRDSVGGATQSPDRLQAGAWLEKGRQALRSAVQVACRFLATKVRGGRVPGWVVRTRLGLTACASFCYTACSTLLLQVPQKVQLSDIRAVNPHQTTLLAAHRLCSGTSAPCGLSPCIATMSWPHNPQGPWSPPPRPTQCPCAQCLTPSTQHWRL
jgi:hypothetical protein